MQSVSHPSLHSSSRAGFTLVLTLIVLSAITLLVLGLFANVTSESSTATNYDNAFRAQTAVRSGLSRVEALLKQGTWSDDYLVLEHMQNPPPVGSTPTDEQWRNRRPVLTLARAKVTGDTTGTAYATEWEYTPLTSGVNPPANTTDTPSLPTTALAAKEDANTKAANITAEGLPKRLPWQPTHDSYWEVIYEDQDADGDPKTPAVKVPVARYCFQVEDLQGLLSLDHAGNPGDAIEEATGMLSRPHEREKIEVFEKVDDASDTPRRWYAGLAPGLRTPDDDPLTDDRKWGMSQAALYSLIDPTSAADTSVIDNQIMVARHTQRSGSPTQVASLLLSPDSWKPILMKEDIANPWPTWLERTPIETKPDGTQITDVDTGRLQDSPARRLEENTITGLKPYYELPLVPAETGVFANPREPRMNLNRVLTQIEQGTLSHEDAVELIVSHIEKHLPTPSSPSASKLEGFSQRSGAFPFPFRASGTQSSTQTRDSCANYLRTLAASIIDYADTDCLPTVMLPISESGAVNTIAYRGCDSYPVVNEQFLVHRYESVRQQDGRNLARYSLTFMYEFWNMSNRPVSGQFEAEYLAKSSVSPPGNRRLDNSFDLIIANPPTGGAGSRWMSLYEPTNGVADVNKAIVTFQPNEYKVLTTLPVTFEFDVGPALFTPATKITTDKDVASGYRIRFQPSQPTQNPDLFGSPGVSSGTAPMTVIDASGGTVEHNERTCNRTSSVDQWATTATLPGSGYGTFNNFIANNVGDPRSAFFIKDVQSLSAYETNASPWGRNLRSGISSDVIYKTAYPSRWPDRGHDTQTGTTTPGSLDRHPAHPALQAKRPPIEPNKAPMRISNAGRYFSETELSNIFDPLFWDPNSGGNGNNPLSNMAAWELFWNIGVQSPAPFSFMCGGQTLRIGRPEHRLFRPGSLGVGQTTRKLCASTLLDLFHCGVSNVGGVSSSSTSGSGTSATQIADNIRDLTGPLKEISGQLNINTATRDVLRAVIAGGVVTDPLVTNATFSPTIANEIAVNIINNRPYISPSQIAEKVPTSGTTKEIQTSFGTGTEWNDSMMEEVFARIYNSSTVRSRHFRVFVTGQAIRPKRSQASDLEVLSTRSRVFHVFVRPLRDPTTGLINDQRIEITYEQDL